MVHLKNLPKLILAKLANSRMMLKGKKFNKHIIVLESDDWGSIRMPSIEVYNTLVKNGVSSILGGKYNQVDTLASNDDLELLLDILSSVKDANGNPAKLTMNCVVANPDFEKIEKSNYEKYYYEPFTETLKRYPNHDRAFALWQEGISNKLFRPQFHGREHLNFQKWMTLLKSGNKDTLACFNFRNYAMITDETEVLEAYNIKSKIENELVLKSISEGLDLFENIFGYRSLSMIAPCYTWNDDIEDIAYQKGVLYIQGIYIQLLPEYMSHNRRMKRSHYLGEKNRNGQIYLTRNCFFEPSQSSRYSAEQCLHNINLMFKLGQPAIISCHRLNFVGGLSSQNRDSNLKEFSFLLKNIIKQYPDVEFRSSDELFL